MHVPTECDGVIAKYCRLSYLNVLTDPSFVAKKWGTKYIY